MNFQHYDLGYLQAGEVVRIRLQGNAANVRLMDEMNFSNYRNGRRYRCIGGIAQKSLIDLVIPNPGSWHLAIDMLGLRGTVRSAIEVIPG